MSRNPIPLFLFLIGFLHFLPAQTPEHLPGQFLFSLSEKADAQTVARRLDPLARVQRVSRLMNIWLLESALPETDLLSGLRRQPEVYSAQFNHTLDYRGLPDDPLFPQQWHLRNDGSGGGVFDADIDAEEAWDIAQGGLTPAGDTIVLAVIDGGIQYSHPDMAQNMWRNSGEIPWNNLDDDQNGYTDDYRGWNVFAENDNIEGNNTAHGTPVSAILGARGNNGVGVTGVNWNTKIMFVAASGSEAAILSAFDYVYLARKRYNDTQGEKGAFVVAVNCSWGIDYGQPSESPLWCEAFDRLGAEGIVSVAATANNPVNVDEVGDLPTTCPSNFLIAVTSLNFKDQKAESAAWGPLNIDLGAYGQEVYTAASSSGYDHFSGTSYAAPQVSGAVGLLYSAPCPSLIDLAKTDPEAAAYWVKSLILENLTPNPSLEGKTAGNGHLNLYRALNAYQGQCSDCPAPFALKIKSLSDSSVTLAWNTPPSALRVNIRWRILGTGPWQVVKDVMDSLHLLQLHPCTPYEFEAQGICELEEESAWSQPHIFKTKGCCVAPSVIMDQVVNSEVAQITWDPASPIHSYRVRIREVGSIPWTIWEADTNYIALKTLKICTAYEWQVQSRCEDWLTDYSQLFTFTTSGCGACNDIPYCFVKGEDATEEWIASVKVGDWTNTSGQGGNGYQNFSNLQTNFPELVSGGLRSVRIAPGFPGSSNKEYFRIYVDFNQDGDFEDENELAFDPGFALEGAAEGWIWTPYDIQSGITRMRVMMKYTTANDTPPEPCTTFPFGQVEDYCVALVKDTMSVGSTDLKGANSGIFCYPQPTASGLWVRLPDDFSGNNAEFRVFDPLGRCVLQEERPAEKEGLFRLDLSRIPAGVYSLECSGAGRSWFGRVIRIGVH